jgi:hypothetical protein
LYSKDIEELTDAAQAVEGTALEDVYEQLIAGSTRHLDAFDNFLT